jgi:hypothetical protein
MRLQSLVLSPILRSAFAAVILSGTVSAATATWDSPPFEQHEGRFWRYHWYERGLTNGDPAYDSRFRVNAPETSLHPQFGRRVEARENGMMLIQAEEDLFQVTGAEFYAEAWGGTREQPINA